MWAKKRTFVGFLCYFDIKFSEFDPEAARADFTGLVGLGARSGYSQSTAGKISIWILLNTKWILPTIRITRTNKIRFSSNAAKSAHTADLLHGKLMPNIFSYFCM